MDWTTLTGNKNVSGSICNWLNRDTTDGAVILSEAESVIFTRLRHWRMKAEVSALMTVAQPYIALPADFIDMREFRLTGDYSARVRRGDERYVQAMYNYDVTGTRTLETPCYYYLSGDSGGRAYLDAVPNLAYGYLITYYQQPTPLGLLNQTNWLTRFYPRLVRSACMVLGAEFEKEAGQGSFDRTYWAQAFTVELGEIQNKSDIVERASDAAVEFA